MNTLSTAEEDINTVPRRGNLRVGLPNPTKLRQQHNYEMLADPAYRIDIWLSDEHRYRALRSTLDAGESHYVPSLGLSECLAEVEYLGEHGIDSVDADGELSVASAVPDAVDSVRVETGSRYRVERSPAFMSADGGGRTTTGFVSYTYDPDGGSLRVRDIRASRVDDRVVMFV
jgi:CRISPR-associated protein Cas5h